MREVIMPMSDKDFDLLMAATAQADPQDDGWTEIVRCKDCKCRRANGEMKGYCPMVLHYTEDNFFCAHGKRRGAE